MKSFIGWIGGKSHLKNQISSLIPNNCTRYIEVFCDIYNEMCDRINLEHLDRICEVLNCDISELLEYQPNKIKKTCKDLIVEANGNRKMNKK